MLSQTKSADPSRENVWQMFDRICGSYDLLNHVLSCGTDILWRRKVSRLAAPTATDSVLDLATGTGDQLLDMLKVSPDIEHGVGVDISRGMLDVGQQKVKRSAFATKASLVHGSALDIPLANESVSSVTIAFGIRNVMNVDQALTEMSRVLKPRGSAVILEFAIPQNKLVKPFYMFYFRHVLPFIGGIISGDRQAYRYLNQTVEQFPYGEAFKSLMLGNGFSDVRIHPLTFGIANIYVGTR